MMRFPHLPLLLLLAVPFAADSAAVQAPNPRGALDATVGDAAITVDYGRPRLAGRMLSDLLAMLPPERVWRAGENQVTILETSADVEIGGRPLAAGRYSVYLHIDEGGNWALLLNRHQGIPLGELWSEAPEAMRAEPWPMLSGYAAIADDEVARIPLAETEPGDGDPDVFEITLDGNDLRFAWGGNAWKTTVTAP